MFACFPRDRLLQTTTASHAEHGDAEQGEGGWLRDSRGQLNTPNHPVGEDGSVVNRDRAGGHKRGGAESIGCYSRPVITLGIEVGEGENRIARTGVGEIIESGSRRERDRVADSSLLARYFAIDLFYSIKLSAIWSQSTFEFRLQAPSFPNVPAKLGCCQSR